MEIGQNLRIVQKEIIWPVLKFNTMKQNHQKMTWEWLVYK